MMKETLEPHERRTLIALARESIEAGFETRTLDLDASRFTEAVRRPAGAFVTLTIEQDLRGCIGSVIAVEPLYRSVARNAVNAAFRDPRFYPLSREEYSRVEIEISVMHPLELVEDVRSIEIGVHGLVVRSGARSGLLLPQVATEYGWDVETFLRETCRKAGLPADAWRTRECRIERFRAEVFGEE